MTNDELRAFVSALSELELAALSGFVDDERRRRSRQHAAASNPLPWWDARYPTQLPAPT